MNKIQIEFTTEQLDMLFLALGMATGVTDRCATDAEEYKALRQAFIALAQHCTEAWRKSHGEV